MSPPSANLLFALIYDHEDGGDIFLRNVWLAELRGVTTPYNHRFETYKSST
jgi:hypothetical protein